ncbi:hypothetical protein GQ44DRAFT_722806 [Phaeosphaeriaceae sp. PMI808]|nr:hypothetical protein GQ44DRAFT_722806 [Phaeosphaeriaceae sp. PMI808]
MRSIFYSRKQRAEVKNSRRDHSSKAYACESQFFAELESNSPFAVEKSAAEESAGETSPKPHTFRVGQYYIEFGRKRPVAKVSSSQETTKVSSLQKETQEKLELCCGQLSELPVQAQELPSPDSMTPVIFDNTKVYELESPKRAVTGFQDDSLSPVEDSNHNLAFQTLEKWNTPPLNRMVHQPLPPVAVPNPQLGLHIENRPYILLDMINTSTSHTPSPVTPITPSLNAGSLEAMHHNEVSPINNIIAQHQIFSPSSNQLLNEEHPYHHTYVSQNVLCTSLPVVATQNGGLAKNFGAISGGYFAFQQNLPLVAPDFPSYRQLNRESSVVRPPAIGQPMPWNRSEFCTMENGDTNGTFGWNVDPDQGWVSTGSLVGHRHTPNYDTLLPSHGVNCSINRPENQFESPEADDRDKYHTDGTIKYTPKFCRYCHTQFNGKFGKGNLARHVRDQHDLSQAKIGKFCRMCEKIFRRGDARRKHEWKKHGMVDAKPIKRRNR